MPYKVIRRFTDSNEKSRNADGRLHVYDIGDTYPVSPYQGAQTKARLNELLDESGPNNNFNGPVIEFDEGK